MTQKKLKGDVSLPYSEEIHEEIFSHVKFPKRTSISATCDFVNIPRSKNHEHRYNLREGCDVGNVLAFYDKPCHAAINYLGWCLCNTDMCIPYFRDKAPMYWSWLVKESPWASIFLSKNPDMYLTKGLMLNTDKAEGVTRGMALGAAIATRSLTEHIGHCCLWFELVERGCDPTYAYAVSMSFSTNQIENEKGLWVAAPFYTTVVNHGGITPALWSESDFSRWMLRNPYHSEAASQTFSKYNGFEPPEDVFYFSVGVPTHSMQTSRYGGGGKIFKYEDLINFYVENEEKILKKCCPKYEKQTLGAVVLLPPKPKSPNLNEPDGDV